MNVKYHFNFTSLDGKDNLVQFLVTDTVTDTEITGMAHPFVVELPELDDIFQVVRGTGATIQLLSETDMQFFDSLYTSDPFAIRVNHYVDGVLNWMGYINSEMMQEPYSFSENYPVKILANNGLALLSRLSFTDSNGDYYSGLKSKYDILKICLDKIGLPWTTINISLSTVFQEYVLSSSSTILHELYNIAENFYTEDPAPMTLREVIETILAPYGAVLWTEADRIYITDINTLAAGAAITYNQFDYSTGAYIQDVTEPINPNFDYMGTGQNIENSGGINKQIIDYSPYVKSEVINKSISAESEFTTVPGSYLAKDGYSYKTLSGNGTWQEISPATFEESYYEDDPQLYLRWAPPATNQKIVSLKVPPFMIMGTNDNVLNPKSGLAFKITFDVLVKTKANPYDSNETGTDFQEVGLYFKFKIGDNYYGHGWSNDSSNHIWIYTNQKGNSISDTFTSKVSNIYNLITSSSGPGLLYGGFDIEIWSDIYGNKDYTKSSTETKNPSEILEIWIKNLEVTIVEGHGEKLNTNDKEYIGLLDPDFQNEGKKVMLKSGTNTREVDLAQELYNDATKGFTPVSTWTRAGQTEQIEKLLLNSYVSNFKAGTNKITNLSLKNDISIWKTLTDSFRAGRVFMLKSAKIDYWDDKIECDVVEIKQDELTIVDL